MEILPVGPMSLAPAGALPLAGGAAADPQAAMEAARAFEQVFLAEMFKHSGVNANPSGFGGGAGEEAFAGHLTGEYARLIAERGGLGLAERIFEMLTARGDGT